MAEVTSAPAAGADNASESALSWAELATYLASEQNAAAMEPRQLAAADSVTEPRSRMQRPERIQRPELPPVQRIQPIRPTAILPPRVKPMRL